MNENEVYEEYVTAQAKARAAYKIVKSSSSSDQVRKYQAALREEYATWVRWVTWYP